MAIESMGVNQFLGTLTLECGGPKKATKWNRIRESF